MRRLLCLGVSLCLAAPAFAGNNELSIGGSTRALRSWSANAVTPDSLGGGALDYARALPFHLLPRLEVWGRAGIAWGDAQGMLFQTMTTDASTFELRVGGRARYELFRWIAATARLDLGTAHTSFTLEDVSGTTSAHDGTWGALASVAIGLDLVPVQRRRFGLGVRAELGYDEAVPVGLTLRSSSPSDGTLQLPMTAASFGHLDLSGPSFTVQLLSQF